MRKSATVGATVAHLIQVMVSGAFSRELSLSKSNPLHYEQLSKDPFDSLGFGETPFSAFYLTIGGRQSGS